MSVWSKRSRGPIASRAWAALVAQRASRRQQAGAGYEPFPAVPVISHEQADLLARYAPGRSFADIGCMWQANGAVSFYAEELGARSVTAFDAMPRTPEFDAEHTRRQSHVEYANGDLHRRETLEPLGLHDVVWCTGVMYHTPFPQLAITHLADLSSDLLIIGNKTIPEVPGVPQAAVYFPGLNANERETYAPLWGDAIRNPFRKDVTQYANWWWGLTPSIMRAMVEAIGPWTVIEEVRRPWAGRFDDYLLVARRSS